MASIAEMFTRLGARGRVNGPARVGVVDIGSNSVRFVAFDCTTRTPSVFFNEKALCALGADLESTGRLSPEGKSDAIEALRRFMALARRMGVGAIQAVGTAALRDAEDGPDFAAALETEIGLSVQVADGAEEARLAAQGVLMGDPTAEGVVADMGGASMELVRVTPEGVEGTGATTPLGPLRVLRWADAPRKRLARIDACIEEALKQGDFRSPPALYILGGSWRAVVTCFMEEQGYPLRVLHGYALERATAQAAAEWVSDLTPETVMELAGVSEQRAAVTPTAAAVLARLLKALKPERVVQSAFGLREGLVWDHLPPELRSRDPLLDACCAIEEASSRMPGFGGELWTWLQGALDPLDPSEARLAEASCLLADANWRTHPDYRARSSFELVTRNNFGGVDHADRVYLGAALLFRHKGGRRLARGEPAMALLGEEALRRAEALGRGVRLGATLSGGARGVLPLCPLAVEKRPLDGDDADGAPSAETNTLCLTLTGDAAELMSKDLRKRLQSFGEALGLPTCLELKP